MAEKMKYLVKAAGISGKDEIAYLLVDQGLALSRGGDTTLGGSFIVAGGALLLIQQFV